MSHGTQKIILLALHTHTQQKQRNVLKSGLRIFSKHQRRNEVHMRRCFSEQLQSHTENLVTREIKILKKYGINRAELYIETRINAMNMHPFMTHYSF